MFYKNSQNCKGSVISFTREEPQVNRAVSSSRAGGGCIGPMESLFTNACMWPLEFLSCTIKDLSPAASVLL